MGNVFRLLRSLVGVHGRGGCWGTSLRDTETEAGESPVSATDSARRVSRAKARAWWETSDLKRDALFASTAAFAADGIPVEAADKAVAGARLPMPSVRMEASRREDTTRDVIAYSM